ncbi:hypothetical protein [Xylella fastidiosa]|uniref:hypothetical protein n=1 Tax=Xylella fastidiosa TaxID=2371 RepID=UPI0034DF739D
MALASVGGAVAGCTVRAGQCGPAPSDGPSSRVRTASGAFICAAAPPPDAGWHEEAAPPAQPTPAQSPGTS